MWHVTCSAADDRAVHVGEAKCVVLHVVQEQRPHRRHPCRDRLHTISGTSAPCVLHTVSQGSSRGVREGEECAAVCKSRVLPSSPAGGCRISTSRPYQSPAAPALY
eukprot:2779905-Rhodomonas_salina.2